MEAKRRLRIATALITALLLPTLAAAHPGSGIGLGAHGEVFFVDMVSGIWKVDDKGALTHLPGPAFHWMAVDTSGKFARTSLPRGSGGDVVRLEAEPSVILASDYPIVIDGALYYPTHDHPRPARLMKMTDAGTATAVTSTLSDAGGKPLTYFNDLAVGPDGALYWTEPNAIRRASADGKVSTIARNVMPASCGTVPGLAGADRPLLRGLAVDGSGTIYVAATGCGSVLKVMPDGKVSVLFQNESGPWSPTGIALSGRDVYVLEFKGAASDDRREMVPRVRKISADGTTRIIATATRVERP